MTQTALHAESPPSATLPPARRWNPRSIGLIVLAWLILHIGGLFTPGLLDDVDSVYLEIAREMLRRHNYITPYVDGIRFFDKPPLMYWLAAGSMHIFGVHDWAGRLPLALLMLALLLATYALGLRLFATVSPAIHPGRAALYSALALATCVGPYLYTRFYIPDIVVALWMTLGVHTFLIALHRIRATDNRQLTTDNSSPSAPSMSQSHRDMRGIEEPRSALVPCVAFAAVLALNVLTKGLIGLVFPLAFVFLYLALTGQLHLIFKLHVIPSTLVFLAIAAPWHILAARRNPPIAMPPGLGLPAHAGWAWFYLYNEHIARFLSQRIPHDYGQTPIWLFWLFTLIWIMPWGAFLPGALRQHIRDLRRNQHFLLGRDSSTTEQSFNAQRDTAVATLRDNRRAALTLFLWTGLVLGFFTLSARQEYYGLPALPALALMVGGFLALAERYSIGRSISDVPAGAPYIVLDPASNRIALTLHRWLLLPLATLIALICGYFALTAPRPAPGTDLSTLLATNPDLYNLSLGHLFDLTGAAMGLFRGPLTVVALGMAVIGAFSYILRRRSRTYAANLALAAGMVLILIATHQAFVRFNPILGSKGLADAILTAQRSEPCPQAATCTSQDVILIDGELTSGSTLLFYTGQPVHLVNGRINGPWFGSLWPDAPHVFETDASLDQLWAGPGRAFLLTYHPDARTADLSRFGRVYVLASAGGKSILTNQP